MIRTGMLTFGSMAFMRRLNPAFGRMVIAAFPLIVAVMAFCLLRSGPMFEKIQTQLDGINAIMQEDVSGIRVIKACVREAYEKARFGKANDALTGTQLSVLTLFAFMNPTVNMMMNVVVALILLAGSQQVQAGATTPGVIMASITYTTQLLSGILILVMLFQNISRGAASWKRVREVLSSEPELRDGVRTEPLRGRIELRDVSFAYPGSEKRVLQHVSLTIEPGETVAIMGATGCGKSTLVRLILRLYDVAEGAVLVDGVDVREYDQRALRGQIAIAMQKLALLSLLTVGLTLLATKTLSGHVRRFSRRRQTLMGRLNGTVEEMIAGYRTVVAYNHQDIITEEFCATSDELTHAGIRTDIFSGVMGPVMNCISNIGFVIIAAFGGYFAVKGLISVGVISAFIVYAKQFSRPINELAQVYGQLQTAVAGAERVFAVLDEPQEDPTGESLGDGEAAVSFRSVNFSYEPGHPVLRDFTLDVPSGRTVALVGATGSGKTTVVNLLMRFYDVDSGEICIDGQRIADVARASLRKSVAIVLQDTVLFSDTVRANLAYASDDAMQERLDHAVSMSQCGEMLSALPEGMDTVLTASGANISQGQRQLLAIARAFVAEPRILILDEATSNVDTRTEKSVQSAMRSIMKGRTSIVIAHRLSTIRDADLIVVMDQGRIVEKGSHAQLLAKHGKYYELYMTQFAGFTT